MASPVYSVKDINQYVARMLQYDPMVQALSVRGEIANLRRQKSGHTYFTLKDDEAALRCVFFRHDMADYGEGDRVIVTGGLGFYQRDGQFQLTVASVRHDGVGSWFERFQQLKERCLALGDCDPACKKPLPEEPKTIGVVTSPSGAVIHDIVTVAQRRWPGVNILLYPVAVQGVDAAGQIAHGIAWMDENRACDVLIVGRGGGSAEDLWPFNEPEVVEAIHSARVPVISAVGHETDFTLADFAADVRAATPSAAAELAVPDVENRRRALLMTARRMGQLAQERIRRDAERLTRMEHRVALQNPGQRLRLQEERLSVLRGRLRQSAENYFLLQTHRLKRQEDVLRAMNPGLVLSRGYAMVERDGKVVTNAAQLASGESLNIRMRDGRVQARVTKVEHEGL